MKIIRKKWKANIDRKLWCLTKACKNWLKVEATVLKYSEK